MREYDGRNGMHVHVHVVAARLAAEAAHAAKRIPATMEPTRTVVLLRTTVCPAALDCSTRTCEAADWEHDERHIARQ